MNKFIYAGVIAVLIFTAFVAGLFQVKDQDVSSEIENTAQSLEKSSPDLSHSKQKTKDVARKRIQVQKDISPVQNDSFKDKLEHLNTFTDFKEVFESLKAEYTENGSYALIKPKYTALAKKWYQSTPDEFIAMLQDMATDIKNEEFLEPLLEGMTETLLKEDPKLALEKLAEVFSASEEAESLAYFGASTLYGAVENNLVEPIDLLKNMDVVGSDSIRDQFADRVLSIWASHSKEDAQKALDWFKENNSSFKENESFIIALASFANDQEIRGEILNLAERDDDKQDAYSEIVRNMINKDLDQTIKWFTDQQDYKKYDRAGTEIVRGLAKQQRYSEALEWTNSLDNNSLRYQNLKLCFNEWKKKGNIKLAESTLLSLDIDKKYKSKLYKNLMGADLPE